ncbi:MAG: tetraacyldisaccharide 4'-kinase, partial [Acidobacteria bacterium]|nr:tetraacyldisaccharide 4'-kinase [Acidobacteriota bacterium]
MKSRLIYFLYRFLLAAASPFIILYLLIRAARNGGYLRSLPERLGQLPPSFQQTGAGAIWLHAVSVGEVLLMAELLRRLRAEFPAAGLYVSTSTLAGRAIADQKLAGLADGVFYAPLDYAWIVRRVLRRLRPCAVVVAETEIWPNLFREAKRAGCGLVIVNGRISDRVAGRYEKLRWFFAHVLCWPDALLVQSEAMAGRYLAAGAPFAKVRVAGNLKYDVEPGKPPGEVLEFLDRLGPARVWIAASTMPPDEDETVIRAFRELAAAFPALLLILAPRKPERFDLVESRLREAGVRYLRRSALGAKPELKLPGVLLLDTIGELSGLFARAEVVFMGGSLVTWGGHNILEPAVFGKPVIVGPYMQNFREMAEAFQQAGALVQVDSGQDLGRAVQELLNDAGRAARIGELGRQCAQAQRGATAAAVVEIGRACRQSAPCVPGPIALWPLARLWEVGSAVKSALAPTGRLTARVISVGNLTLGGTGKTPTVMAICQFLLKNSRRPAVLSRGYGGRTGEAVRVVSSETGADRRLEALGDEPCLMADRLPGVPVFVLPD